MYDNIRTMNEWKMEYLYIGSYVYMYMYTYIYCTYIYGYKYVLLIYDTIYLRTACV